MAGERPPSPPVAVAVAVVVGRTVSKAPHDEGGEFNEGSKSALEMESR